MNWISNIILGLLEQHSVRDVYELYDCLQIEIRLVEPSHILLKGHEAFYYRYFDDNEIVFIRNDLNPKCEKFILAHELGHAVLHTHVYEAAFNKDLLNIGKIEKQANCFALELSNLYFDEIDLNEMTLTQIASCIEVPEEALKQLVKL